METYFYKTKTNDIINLDEIGLIIEDTDVHMSASYRVFLKRTENQYIRVDKDDYDKICGIFSNLNGYHLLSVNKIK